MYVFVDVLFKCIICFVERCFFIGLDLDLLMFSDVLRDC